MPHTEESVPDAPYSIPIDISALGRTLTAG
jgi:hypothetical protein